MPNLPMVDLKGQYSKIKHEIDSALINCVEAAQFIKGPEVRLFEDNLAQYLNVKHVVACGNGTDALQIALMALNLNPGDEIIIPAFTYVATAEAIALLQLVPVMVDVNTENFNIATAEIEKAITPKTKAIIPVHLYGQSADMHSIMEIAKKYGLYVIEDNAQALGAEYTFPSGDSMKTGCIGHIGCNSFFPTKNLGCFGDGGAITTNNTELAERCRMIAAHGQKKKYHHSVIGCNSRLDTIQAAILNVKLKYFSEYITARQEAAKYYSANLSEISWLEIPKEENNCKHTFNQFTLKINNGKRDQLQNHLKEKGIPSIIYYPLPLYKQEAFKRYLTNKTELSNTEFLCNSVLSIPIHTELTHEVQDKIIETIKAYK
jgi:UDP-2-acetamido-2-deoxy-ribo-hexuluronate aminotransferase